MFCRQRSDCSTIKRNRLDHRPVDPHDTGTGSFPLGLDSTLRIAGVLVQMQQDKLGIDYLDRRAGLIGGVTLDEARAVAKKMFDPAALSFAIVGDPADVKPTRPPKQQF